MRVYLFIGTKSQFIKMVPVLLALREQCVPFTYIDSGQHAERTASLRALFGIGDPDVTLGSDEDVATVLGALRWAGPTWLKLPFMKKELRDRLFPEAGVCLIHGDTLSTLMGLEMARKAGIKVAHVEAGLRSRSVWNPFPEELIRKYCMKRSDLLFAPSEEALQNLNQMRVQGQVIGLPGNTVIDALALTSDRKPAITPPENDYALVTCHRFETLMRKRQLRMVVDLLNRTASRIPVLFVLHKPTSDSLRRFGLEKRLSKNIQLMDLMDYQDFIALLSSARMVLSDGGSIQEECALYGKPCLILRSRTERRDGLGKNAMLWKFDPKVDAEFFTLAESYDDEVDPVSASPTQVLLDELLKWAN